VPKWLDEFESWNTAKSPRNHGRVKAALKRVFGDRLEITTGSGGSHDYKIRVPELRALGYPEYRYGFVRVVLKGGQQIKAPYLKEAYRAAMRLVEHDHLVIDGGIPDEEEDDENREEDNDD